MSVTQPDLELPHRDDLLLRPGRAQALVEVAADDVNVGGEGLQVVVGVTRAEVA